MIDKETIVEVVMRKNMTLAKAKAQKLAAVKKGWDYKSYELGFVSQSTKKEIE